MKKLILTSIVTLAASSALMAGVNPATCKGCHGVNFEKKALGRSEIVANLTHDEIAKRLIAFKTTTEGDEMIMKAQVGKYSDADLEAFSKTIGK